VRRALVALVLLLACTRIAAADDEHDADVAFRAAEQHAAAGDAHAVDELEAIGAHRPITRWSDDAWLEASRFAERAGDYARAQRDVQQALAITTDDRLARRARGELARLAEAAGDTGQWAHVAVAHEQLEQQVAQGGDPKPALAQLEALVAANPGYPRAWAVMVVIAGGWERDGDAARAIDWLRRAKQAAPSGRDRVHATAELARTLIRAGELADARAEIDGIGDPIAAGELGETLGRAEVRRDVRWAVLAVLGVLALASVVVLRRAAGSWRAAGKRLARPPIEAIFLLPIAIGFVIVAQTGNPLVARSVRMIAIAGVAIAWISGALLDAVRARRGSLGRRRAVAHALLAALAALGIAFLAVDRDHVVDLIIETWHEGPELR
jgi:tetratricopeptide (TPR) repeat protein